MENQKPVSYTHLKKTKEANLMRMSDLIEEFIKELFDEDNQLVEIQRNELAEQFNCVPSQINYVISTRFKPSQGYYVESRRGGGGCLLYTSRCV